MGVLDRINLKKKEETEKIKATEKTVSTKTVKELPTLETLMQGIRIERKLQELPVQPVAGHEVPAPKKSEEGIRAILVSTTGQRYEAVGPVCILGSSDDADLQISDPALDELQAVILWKNGVCCVANDFSPKMIKVNGCVVNRGMRLPLDKGGRLELPGGVVLTREQ